MSTDTLEPRIAALAVEAEVLIEEAWNSTSHTARALVGNDE